MTMRPASPNLFLLATLVLSGTMLAQDKSAVWREYAFSENGFAITLPHPPRIHPDRNIPDTTAYSVNISPDKAFTLRVTHESRDCDTVMDVLRANVLKGKDKAIRSSLKELPSSGVAYEADVSDDTVVVVHYYCGQGRVYILGVDRERTHSLPAEASKILNSFRLLPPDAK